MIPLMLCWQRVRRSLFSSEGYSLVNAIILAQKISVSTLDAFVDQSDLPGSDLGEVV